MQVSLKSMHKQPSIDSVSPSGTKMSSGSCHAGLRCLGVDGARSEEHGLGGRLSAANNGLL